MKYKSFLFLMLSFSLLFPLAGCSGSGGSAHARLESILSLCPALPAGTIYDSDAADWEKEALPNNIRRNLYQNQDGESAFSLADSYAVFFASGIGGGEAAVFIAEDPAMREGIGEICAMRLSLLRSNLSDGDRGACVLHEGDAVILLFLPGSEEIWKAL